MQNTDVKTKRSKKPTVVYALAALLAVLVLLTSFGRPIGFPDWNKVFTFWGIYTNLGDDLSLSFIDEGSADVCYIKCHGKNILVDTGLSIKKEKLNSYLQMANCRHFDAVIISHPDSDHVGAASYIIDKYGTDRLYMTKLPQKLLPKTMEYELLCNSIKENKTNVVYPKSNSCVNIGDLKLNFISPQKSYSEMNDNSLVVRLSYKSKSFLFTGDISSTAEKDLINSKAVLNSDVLKVAHHGSKTSSSQEFLKAVSPQISVVCVGSGDSLLPDYSAISRIKHFSSSVYRTDTDKNIVITYDGKNLQVHTNA